MYPKISEKLLWNTLKKTKNLAKDYWDLNLNSLISTEESPPKKTKSSVLNNSKPCSMTVPLT